VVLVSGIKSLDLVACKAVKIEKVPQMIIDEVAAILMAIIE